MAAEFWKRWKREYIQSLQERQKWQQKTQNLKVNDVVLVKEAETHRNEWPLGKITQVMPSADGLVRKVNVKISQKGKCVDFERPIHKVVLVYRP